MRFLVAKSSPLPSFPIGILYLIGNKRLAGSLLLTTLALACSRGDQAKSQSFPDLVASTEPAQGRGAASAASPGAESPTAAVLAPRALDTPASVTPPVLAYGGARVVESTRGVVSSVEANASQAGIAILKAGGNAVDAAVAVAYALAVTHPSAGNIGGGGFMLIKLRGQATVALDFRETAPRQLTQAFFDRMIRAGANGAAAVAVPGSVRGLTLAHESFGRLPRAQVMAPAIALAENGYKLGREQARALSRAWPELRRDAEARRIFGAQGRAKTAGALLVQSELARTLSRIAAVGDAGFYDGPTAEALSAAFKAAGGLIDAEDLRGYRAVLRTPLSISYRGYTVETMPPPSAGGVAVVQTLLALEQLKAYELPPASPANYHLFIEVAKRASAERRFRVMDPDWAGYNPTERLTRWYDPRALIDHGPPIAADRVTPASAISPLYQAALRELEHTTHFSVADFEGNVVSCTTTLSAGFGARFIAPQTGVVLNNSLAAFATVGDSTPAAGKRTTSSMAPTLVSSTDGPVLVLGSPGGDTIPNTLVQVLRNLVDYHMTLAEAVDAPRIHHGFVPDAIRYETRYPPSAGNLAALKKLGHVLVARPVIGDANIVALRYQSTKISSFAYADPREAGLALGAD